jgi:hypothetical protein
MSELQTGQQEIFDYVKNNLGEGMIDVELDPKHYQTALERAVNRYRQRSSNAVEESYAFLELKENQNSYILPDEVINVRNLNRRTVGSRTEGGEGGTLFEHQHLPAEGRSHGRTGNILRFRELSRISWQDVW